LASPQTKAEFNAILWDNDALSPRETDAYYTNGIIYHHVSDPQPSEQGRRWSACPGLNFLSELVEPALIPADGRSRYWHSWEAGQVIQTPLNKQASPPDPDDQPYAGLLYAGCNWHVQTDDRAESLGLQFGLVGPWSQAEHTQSVAHHVAGAVRARGWDGQLRNEVVVNLRYDRQEVLRRTELGVHGLSIFDNMDFALGPLMTSVGAGVNFLYAADPDAVFGLNPNYLGRYPRMTRGRPLGFYTMGGLQLTGVLRNLFLNGNTWVDSPARVDHEPLIGSAQALVGYGFSCWALQLGLNVSTRTFQQQEVEWPRYGSLAFTWGCGP
jgi:hypothetical protein